MAQINYKSTDFDFKYVDENKEYREVDSITAMPNAFVDTGYTANNNTSIDCKFMWHDIHDYNFAFGSGTAYNGGNIEMYNSINDSIIQSYYNGNGTTNARYTAMKPFRMYRQKNVVSIYDEDGKTLISTYTASEATFTCGSVMHIFRINRDGYYTSKPQTCYYFKIWDNDILVRDYVPCIREKDKVAGFYDRVNKTFVTSGNANKLIAGNDITATTATTRYYYKYIWEQTNTPVFDDVIEATNGKNGVKVNIGTDYYYITQNNSGHTMGINNTVGFDLGEQSKNISYIGFIGVVVGGRYPGIVMTNIQASEDGENWDLIASSYGGRGDYLSNPLRIATPNNYRYIKFTSSDDDLRYNYGGIYNVRVGYDKREVTAGTEDNHDFYVEVASGATYMYAEPITKRKYYKKVAYVQPAFGANTYEYDMVVKGRNTKHVKFELTASHQSQPAWYAFNRSLTGDNCWWTAHGVTSASNPCWLTFQSNNKMLFNRVWLMNENTSPENFKHCTLQASNNNLNWTNLIEFYGTNVGAYVTSVDIPKEKQAPYHYYRLYFDSSYSIGGVSFQLITFEGSMLIESNEEDYDYYEEYTAFDVEPDNDKLFYKYNGVENPVPATIEDYDFYIKKGLTFTAQAN